MRERIMNMQRQVDGQIDKQIERQREEERQIESGGRKNESQSEDQWSVCGPCLGIFGQLSNLASYWEMTDTPYDKLSD